MKYRVRIQTTQTSYDSVDAEDYTPDELNNDLEVLAAAIKSNDVLTLDVKGGHVVFNPRYVVAVSTVAVDD